MHGQPELPIPKRSEERNNRQRDESAHANDQ